MLKSEALIRRKEDLSSSLMTQASIGLRNMHHFEARDSAPMHAAAGLPWRQSGQQRVWRGALAAAVRAAAAAAADDDVAAHRSDRPGDPSAAVRGVDGFAPQGALPPPGSV